MSADAFRSSLLLQDIQRIVVYRALVIGDLLCTVPALRALRKQFPQARICLVSLPWAAEFVRRFDRYLDDFISFPGFPGLPERPVDVRAFPDFLRQVQREKFDLALQIHGSGSFVNPLIELFGARQTAGFYLPGEYCPNMDTFIPYPEGLPESDRQLRLLESLGIPSQGRHLEWPLKARDEQELDAIADFDLKGEPFVCLHPGARFLSRRWHSERFAAVGDDLQASGWRVVITGAPAERSLAETVARQMRVPPINLAGRTSLAAMGALLVRSRLLICNDTGVSHLAAALQVPSVVVVTGSDPARWAPLDTRRHRVVMQPIACRPCPDPICPIGLKCADLVEPAEVVRCALSQLEAFADPLPA